MPNPIEALRYRSMARDSSVKQGSLVIPLRAGAGERAYWDAQWRYRIANEEPWRLKKRDSGSRGKNRTRAADGANARAVARTDGVISGLPTSQRSPQGELSLGRHDTDSRRNSHDLPTATDSQH